MLLPGATFEADRLLAPQQALLAYAAAVRIPVPAVESVGIDAAFGRVLAEDAIARTPFPAGNRSTMDGFAVRSSEGGATRRISAEIRMGQAPPGPLGAGEAMRIPTGGVLPEGADAVVPIEDADVVVMPGEVGEAISVREIPQAGAAFTPRGSDMAPGDRAIAAGRRIGGPELGVLATLGITQVAVYRRPRVAIISTGDELVDTSSEPNIGQVRDSNRWAIAGALIALGADPVHLERAPDDLDALRARVAEGLDRADAVILTGGSSVGERDLTPDVIAGFGAPGVIVHGLRVKPGKPTVLAAIGGKPVIGLPGNPTSALMILEAVCAPIVAHLTGERGRRAESRSAVAGEAFAGRAGWTWFVPAEIRLTPAGERAFPLPLRSAHTSLLARAHGYVTLTEDRSHIGAGEPVSVVRFSGGGRA
ncbi:MAG: molybdopterin-binding protein [Candidatus Velthaea sp.]